MSQLFGWPKYWNFSLNISPSNEHPGLISFRMDWLDLLAVQGPLKSLLQHHSSKASILQHSAFFIVQLSHPYVTTGKTTIAFWTHKSSLQIQHQCFRVKEKKKKTLIFVCTFVLVQWLSHVQVLMTPWTAACQASLTSTISQGRLRFMFIDLEMLCNHLNLFHPLLLPPSTFPSINVFSMSWYFTSSGQSIRASASVPPMNI